MSLPVLQKNLVFCCGGVARSCCSGGLCPTVAHLALRSLSNHLRVASLLRKLCQWMMNQPDSRTKNSGRREVLRPATQTRGRYKSRACLWFVVSFILEQRARTILVTQCIQARFLPRPQEGALKRHQVFRWSSRSRRFVQASRH